MKFSKHTNIPNAYQAATKGLQNYGRNIRKNIAKHDAEFQSGAAGYHATRNPLPNPFKKSSYK